jgi:hypothetical protein
MVVVGGTSARHFLDILNENYSNSRLVIRKTGA